MVVIIGGGISGLSAAWFLNRLGVGTQVIESRPRLGGLIESDRSGHYLVEGGPNSTLLRAAAGGEGLGRLIAEAGLTGEMEEPSSTGQRRYVVRGGRLRALPGAPPAFLATRLFSWRAKLRLLREPFIGAGRGEESISRFVERRLGREFLDYAVEPFISGVFAGDPATLSVRAAVPRIYELEQTYGSLIRGAIALRKVAKGAGSPSGRLISFAQGMSALPDAIRAALPPETCLTGRKVVALESAGEGWIVHWRGSGAAGIEHSRNAVLAVPAPDAAELVEPLSGEAARILRSIAYAPIASVAVGFERSQVSHPLDGFGFLSPRRECLRTLGALFSSSLFAGRAPAGRVLVTAFIGGSTDPGALELDDDSLLATVLDDLTRTLGTRGAPEFTSIARHERAIPQYTVGHLDRLARLDRLMERFPGLYLRASWRDGVSVADCVGNGEALARRIADDTASGSGHVFFEGNPRKCNEFDE